MKLLLNTGVIVSFIPHDSPALDCGFTLCMQGMRLVLYSWQEKAEAETYCGKNDSSNSCHGGPGMHELCLLEPAEAALSGSRLGDCIRLNAHCRHVGLL